MRYFFLLIAAICLLNTAEAQQTSVSVSFNIGSQPVWGPTGYEYAQYYYLPDIEVYYSVAQRRFYRNEGGRWYWSSRLPSRYNNYDLYNSYKVVVNEPTPYYHHKRYRNEYSQYSGRRDQPVIRDSRDSKYYVIKKHPEHDNWAKQSKHGKGNGNKHNNQNNGQGKDKDH